jgi:hypothetical protein
MAVPAAAPTEGEAGLWAGPGILHRLPRAQGARREDGGMHPNRPPVGQPPAHLPRLRPAYISAGQSHENRCDICTSKQTLL